MIKVCLFFTLLSILILPFFVLNPDSGKLRVPTWNVGSKTLTVNENEFQPKTPNIEQIFQEDHTWIATVSAEKRWTMIATGDIIPARSVNFQTVTRHNFNWPFEKTADILKSANLTFINLESPLVSLCPVTQEGMVFCGDERNLEGLKFAGVDVANLANNHSGNHGQAGLDNTVKLLSSAGITASGLSEPAYRDLNGLKIAFLGYNDLDYTNENLESEYTQQIRNNIELTKKSADLVIVAFHWGIEYTDQPTQRQRNLAHFAIDAGADLIIGNHPHWIQPIEIYHDKLITYAHGNFVFDQMWSEKTKEGVIGKYTFLGNKLIDVEFMPVKIENYGQPHFLEGLEKQRILDEMKENGIKLQLQQ